MQHMARAGLLIGAAIGLLLSTAAIAAVAPASIIFPYTQLTYLEVPAFNEPSGITYFPARGTLFVVGDSGDIGEMKTDGTLLRQVRVRDADFEGITSNPVTGLLYVAIEGEERILEIEPESFAVRREFPIDRHFGGKELLKAGGQGVEAITFVPDATHPEGGTFFLGNQGFADTPQDPSVIVEVVAPLKTGVGTELPGRIVRAVSPGIVDIAALHYDPASRHLYFVSDTTNTLWEMTLGGRLVRGYALPGNDQEGLTVDSQGWVYIAQDSGSFLKFRWNRAR